MQTTVFIPDEVELRRIPNFKLVRTKDGQVGITTNEVDFETFEDEVVVFQKILLNGDDWACYDVNDLEVIS